MISITVTLPAVYSAWRLGKGAALHKSRDEGHLLAEWFSEAAARCCLISGRLHTFFVQPTSNYSTIPQCWFMQPMLLTCHPCVSQVQRCLRLAVEKWKLSVCLVELSRIVFVTMSYTIAKESLAGNLMSASIGWGNVGVNKETVQKRKKPLMHIFAIFSSQPALTASKPWSFKGSNIVLYFMVCNFKRKCFFAWFMSLLNNLRTVWGRKLPFLPAYNQSSFIK